MNNEFKAGEKVLLVINRRLFGNSFQTRIIERETKTQYILNDDRRIVKETLKELGNTGVTIQKIDEMNTLRLHCIKASKSCFSVTDEIVGALRSQDAFRLIYADRPNKGKLEAKHGKLLEAQKHLDAALKLLNEK